MLWLRRKDRDVRTIESFFLIGVDEQAVQHDFRHTHLVVAGRVPGTNVAVTFEEAKGTTISFSDRAVHHSCFIGACVRLRILKQGGADTPVGSKSFLNNQRTDLVGTLTFANDVH